MSNKDIEKYKMQISLYIREMFFHFKDISAVDLVANNFEQKDVFGNIEDNYQIFLIPYLSAEKIKSDLNLNYNTKINIFDNLYKDNTGCLDNIKIIDWQSLENNKDILINTNKSITIKHKNGQNFNYNQFEKQFLNFIILKDINFIENLLETEINKYTNKTKIVYRFIAGDTMSIFNFLGQHATSLLNKYEINESINIDKNLNHHKFKL